MRAFHMRDLARIVDVLLEALALPFRLSGIQWFAVLLDEAKNRPAGSFDLLPHYVLSGGNTFAAVFPVAVALAVVQFVVDDVPHQVVGRFLVVLGRHGRLLGPEGYGGRDDEHNGSEGAESWHGFSSSSGYDPVHSAGVVSHFG